MDTQIGSLGIYRQETGTYRNKHEDVGRTHLDTKVEKQSQRESQGPGENILLQLLEMVLLKDQQPKAWSGGLVVKSPWSYRRPEFTELTR